MVLSFAAIKKFICIHPFYCRCWESKNVIVKRNDEAIARKHGDSVQHAIAALRSQ
jgi:hypothetical protein